MWPISVRGERRSSKLSRTMMARRHVTFVYLEKPRKRRPGVHAKTKSSKCKSSKNYLKRYRGQGR